MNIRKVSHRLYISEQLIPSEIGIAATAGIRTIINNRPDCETPDQPETQAIIEAASAVGIDVVHIPIDATAISDTDIEEFSDIYRNAEGPILAYCRSGMRSTVMWALTQAATMDIDVILLTAKEIGYDITGMLPRLQALADAAAGSTGETTS